MGAYLARRLLLALVTVWLVTIVVFLLLRVAPGDAVVAAIAQAPGEGTLTADQIDARREALGLNRAYAVQYFDWLGDLMRLDAGRSLVSGASIWSELRPRFAVTAELALISMLLIGIAGPAAGVLAAAFRGRLIDRIVRGAALGLMSLPQFWVGLVVILVLAGWFGYFRAVEYQPFWQAPWRNLEQVGLPALVLALRPAALLARVVRTSMLDALEADFVRTARSKGLDERTVLVRHVFRAAMLPALTVLAAQVVFLLGGAVVIESVFNLPGLGRALALGVSLRDYPLVQFLVLTFAVAAVVVNLVVDLAYTRLDPRVILAAERS